MFEEYLRSPDGRNSLRRTFRDKGMARAFSRDEVEEFFARLKKQIPEPKTELQSVQSLHACSSLWCLSAQATDKGVNKATEPLFKIVDTPEKMVALGEEKLTDYIKTIGLYRNKAKNVIALSKLLVEKHGGEVPRTREELEALPGVGRKTANVVLNVAFGEKTIAVDTHIFRVCNRTGLAPGKDVLAVELELEKNVPDKFKLHAHHWLILHGRYTCMARKPLCPTCVVRDLCRFKDKTKEGAAIRKPAAQDRLRAQGAEAVLVGGDGWRRAARSRRARPPCCRRSSRERRTPCSSLRRSARSARFRRARTNAGTP